MSNWEEDVIEEVGYGEGMLSLRCILDTLVINGIYEFGIFEGGLGW